MRADFPLIDQTPLGLVNEFDRVFNGQDMTVMILVDVVDHPGKRRGLAGTGRAGHQHHAAGLIGNFLKNLRCVQIFQRQNLGRDRPHHRAGTTVLNESVDPETGQTGDREREIHLKVFFVFLALVVIHDVVDHAVDILMLHWRQIDPAHIPVHANHRRQPR